MKRLIIVALTTLLLVTVAGCSQETKDSAVDVFDSLKGFGEDVFNDIDKAVQTHTTPGASEDEVEFDVLADKINSISKAPYIYGDDVISIISGIKSSGLTVLIQRAEENEARVLGKLVTCDGCQYVEGINELEPVDGEYLYDFCGVNGILRSALQTTASRRYEVYRYDEYSTNIQPYADLSKEDVFDVLTLVEGKEVVGFYFSEREVD